MNRENAMHISLVACIVVIICLVAFIWGALGTVSNVTLYCLARLKHKVPNAEVYIVIAPRISNEKEQLEYSGDSINLSRQLKEKLDIDNLLGTLVISTIGDDIDVADKVKKME